MEIAFVVVAAAVGALIGYGLGRRSNRAPDVGPLSTEASPDAALSVPTPQGLGPVAPVGAEASGSVQPIDIERALADLRLGVVVVGSAGNEVYRNNRAQEYATGRHGNALVEAALQRVVEGGLLGLSLEESVEVYGPPARSLTVQASPTYDDGVLSGVVGVVDDVTESRHLLKVRSDFVANVSHELRTPAGAMSVLAETIAEADDPEVIERLAQRMLREATRLADTIEDLLALSRLESGPVDDPETIDLASVALMAMERTAEAAEQREVEVTLAPDSGAPILIDGDQGQLVSAVANLVDNAIKYSDSGGEVQIRIGLAHGASGATTESGSAARSPVQGEREYRPAPDREGRWSAVAQRAELSVFDNGIGIPERDLERIFERFYRVDSGRSRETGGTGLGLSIVRNAVLNHRGTVDVDSMEGRGTTFTVRLPLSASQARVADRDIDIGTAPADADANADADADELR